MSPPTLDHQTIAFEVAQQLRNVLEGKPRRIFMAPLDALLSATTSSGDDSIDTVVQPDVLVVYDPKKLTPRGVRGAPGLDTRGGLAWIGQPRPHHKARGL